MTERIKVLFAASEALPLIKTGGLADVCGALPPALRKLGVDVRLVVPAYPAALKKVPPPRIASTLELLGTTKPVRILETAFDGVQPVYLVDAPEFFDRPGNPYLDETGRDWPDSAARFCLFARAVTALALGFGDEQWQPDLVHCHDWQTGLVPALLSLQPQAPPSLFTIHNLAYQGLFPHAELERLELPERLWSPEALEFYGRLSFIKGGLVFADRINTVSPTYKEEICTPEFGCGLDGLLRKRADVLSGIVNGADYSIWNPATDKMIAAPYSIADFIVKKPQNKKQLQQQARLAPDPKIPLLGMVGRLVIQKGIDLVIESLPQLIQQQVQLVILGSGERGFERSLQQAAAQYPGQVAFVPGYHEATAHLIQAGADIFLMPSRFEPCGLSQLYAMRYGTVPVVRKTGGLADTVVNTTAARLQQNTATGFSFKQPTPESLLKSIQRALTLFAQQAQWHKLMRNAMQQCFSWESSAKQYRRLYTELLAGKKTTISRN